MVVVAVDGDVIDADDSRAGSGVLLRRGSNGGGSRVERESDGCGDRRGGSDGAVPETGVSGRFPGFLLRFGLRLLKFPTLLDFYFAFSFGVFCFLAGIDFPETGTVPMEFW